MPKTFFTPGTPITSNWLNSVNNPTFVANPTEDGQNPLIRDTDLSGDADQLKRSTYDFIDSFRVEGTSGLTLTVWTAKRMLASGEYRPAGTININLPPSTSGDVWLSWLTGDLFVSNVATGQNPKPSSCYSIFTYQTDNANIIAVNPVFQRARYQDVPAAKMLSLFGGRSLTNQVWTANATTGNLVLGSTRYGFNDLTINIPDANFGLEFNNNCLIQCAGNLVINGHVGTSGYSILRQLPTASGMGAVFSNGNTGIIHYNPTSGSLPVRVENITWSVDQQGRPGSSSSGILAGYGAVGGNGGAGGGRLHFQVAGTITINGRVLISANGGSGLTHSTNFGVVGTMSDRVFVVTGGSGGSGGLILVQCGTRITHNGVTLYQANAGNGGDATAFATGSFASSGVMAVGGAGGGGGWVVEECPEVVGAASTQFTAGNRGSDVGFLGSNTSFGVGSSGSGFGGRGGAYLLTTITPTIPGDILLGFGNFAYRPPTVGLYERNLRFPIVF